MTGEHILSSFQMPAALTREAGATPRRRHLVRVSFLTEIRLLRLIM